MVKHETSDWEFRPNDLVKKGVVAFVLTTILVIGHLGTTR